MSTAPGSAGRRRGPWRWFVALLATVLLVVSGSGLVAFAQSGSGEDKGPAFVPESSALYVVGRLDMPDGQGESLASFLSAFPGFTDTASFDLKADQLIDGLVEEATGGALTYSGELQSFLTGEIGLTTSDITTTAMTGGEPEALVGIAISDRAAAESFVDLLTAGATGATEEPYGDTTIVSDGDMALAVHDEWVLVGQSVDQVEIGIDVLEGAVPSLADNADFQTAWARVPAGHLAGAYLNLSSLSPLLGLGAMAAEGRLGADIATEDLLAQLPTDMTAYLAASPDRLTLEAFITPSEQTMALASGESDLATVFPADTQLYVETRELGGLLETAVTTLLESMDEEQAAQLEPIESMLGVPFPSFLDFVSDASIGASLNSDGLWLGIAAEVTDEATAASRLERILSIVRFAEMQSTDIEVEETTVNGSTVTTLTLPIDDATAGSGLPIPIGDTISLAVSDGTLLIGTGDFVSDALVQDPVDSLALSPGYVDALGDDTANAGVLYANVSALLTTIDPLIGFMVPEWQDIQPYATAVDRFIAVGSVEDVISSKMSVIVDS